MRHMKKGRILGRVKRQRLALIRSLARSLILSGRITTTLAKAKELRPFVERVVTAGKIDTVTARRLVAHRLGSTPEATRKIFARN